MVHRSLIIYFFSYFPEIRNSECADEEALFAVMEDVFQFPVFPEVKTNNNSLSKR